SVDELLLWMTEDTAFNLIDVREEHEFNNDHLAQSIPFPLSRILGNLLDSSKNKPSLIICRQGRRSKKAVDYLKEKDPTLQLLNLTGGLNDWTKRIGSKFLVT